MDELQNQNILNANCFMMYIKIIKEYESLKNELIINQDVKKLNNSYQNIIIFTTV